MSGVNYLLSIYPISSQGLPEEHATAARELERQLIIKTYADAMVKVGMNTTNATKIAIDYYEKNLHTMTPEIFLAILSIAGASVPFGLNNQMDPLGPFGGYKVFRCPVCISFWLALIVIALMGGNPVYAGLAPIFAQLIHKTLY